MAQVRLQRRGDAGGKLAMGLMGQRREINDHSWSLLRPWAVAPEHPLERHALEPTLPRPRHDQPRYICGKFRALRPLLDRGLGDGGTQLRGELAVRQADGWPRAERVQQPGL